MSPLQAALRFDGPAESTDPVRLGAQLKAIVRFMRSGSWHTLAEISAATGAPEASVSAQLRNARKDRHGGSIVERRHEGGGLYRYSMRVSAATLALLSLPPTQPRLEVAT